MTEFLSIGLLLGLSAGFAPGPLSALVVAETLRYDARAGIRVALAPLITDLPIVAVSLFLLLKLARFQLVLGVVSILGGLVVLGLGWENLRTKGLEVDLGQTRPQSLRKGIIVNALNPHPYLFWVSVGGPTFVKALDRSLTAAMVFITGFYLLLIGSKIFMAFIVGRSRDFLTGRPYLYLMRFLGSLLCLFALLLFNEGLKLWGFW